jgi:uncharacterized protein (DUF2252 family)
MSASKGVTPEIPLGERFWPLSPREQRAIHEMFSAREVRRLITCLQDRDEEDNVKVMDAAYWMKGCSSLGRLRYAVLRIGKKKHKNEKYCLIDIKEAV